MLAEQARQPFIAEPTNGAIPEQFQQLQELARVLAGEDVQVLKRSAHGAVVEVLEEKFADAIAGERYRRQQLNEGQALGCREHAEHIACGLQPRRVLHGGGVEAGHARRPQQACLVAGFGASVRRLEGVGAPAETR